MIRPTPSRRLLVITYHYPPDGAVGGLRWSGLAKYLARMGWEVHVLTAASGAGAPAVDGVHRHECAPRRTLNEFYASFVRRRRGSAPRSTQSDPTVTPARSSASPKRFLGFVRALARVALAFPDVGRGWVLRAARVGRKLQKQHGFDFVVTSGPPHSAHFAGWLVALGNPSVTRVMDMRDPWVGNKNFPLYGMDPGVLYPMIGVLERFLFKRARTVIVNTREFADELQRTEPQLSVVHVSNGIDLESLPARTAELFEGISLAYLGTFYAGRSFSALLAAFKAVAQDRPRDAERIKLRIAGNIDPAQGELLRAALAREGLGGMIELLGTIPRTRALELLSRSHLALVLAQGQRTQIPAKLYECVGLGVPTLVITESDSAAASEAHRIGAIVVETEDVAGMRRILEDLLDGAFPATIRPTAPISYQALARQVDDVLVGLSPRTSVDTRDRRGAFAALPRRAKAIVNVSSHESA